MSRGCVCRDDAAAVVVIHRRVLRRWRRRLGQLGQLVTVVIVTLSADAWHAPVGVALGW